jgi:MFS family permease
MDNLGAIVGPLLAIGLVGLVGVRTAIALSIIPGLLAALAIVYAIRHVPRAEQRERQPLRLRIRPVLTGRLGRLMVGVAAFEFGNVAATLLILRASELLTPGRDQDRATQLALGLYVAYNVAATAVSVPAGRLGDRRGAVLVLVLGVGLFGLAYAGFAAGASSVLALAPWFLAAGVAIGCVETAEHAAVAGLAPVELRGSAFGLLAAVQSFGNLAASAIAGLLWTAVSPRVGLRLPGGVDGACPRGAARGPPQSRLRSTDSLLGRLCVVGSGAAAPRTPSHRPPAATRRRGSRRHGCLGRRRPRRPAPARPAGRPATADRSP